MRAELNNLENIDLYLSGKLSGAEKAAFEAQMAADPALKSVVEDQQLLIQTVNRKALLAEINSVAGLTATTVTATAWGLSKILWTVIGSVVVVGGVTTAIIYGSGGEQAEQLAAKGNENPQEEMGAPVYEDETDDEIDTNISQADQDALVIIDEMVYGMDGETSDGSTSSDLSTPLDDRTNSREVNERTESDGSSLRSHQEDEVSESNQNGSSTSGGVRIQERPVDASQATEEDRNLDLKTFSNAHLNARFPGGDEKRNQWVKKRLRYPETPKRKDLEAVVKVTFFVNADGNKEGIESDLIKMNRQGGIEEPFSGARILRNMGSAKLFEREASRIVRIMPDWEPATDRFGNPKFSETTVFVKFDIDDGCYLIQIN